jgi:hypothetical protein
MPQNYIITPTEAAALRAVAERIVESTSLEVAVSSQLPPSLARHALVHLQERGYVNRWMPSTSGRADDLFVCTDEGRLVYNALASFRGKPPVGTRVPVSSRGLLWSSPTSSVVEVVPDEQPQYEAST